MTSLILLNKKFGIPGTPRKLTSLHLSYPVALNDLCDLKNKVKVTQFKLGLCHALVLPCTKFGEHTSNISSDIKRKPF